VKLAVSNLALPAYYHFGMLPYEDAGLSLIGMHGLFPYRSDLGVFTSSEKRARSLDLLVQLSTVTRDLGGRTLILESRWRNNIPERDVWLQCRDFLHDVLPRIEGHGTVPCFAPLAPADGDFCRQARQCYMLTNAIDHDSFGLRLGAAALAANGEMGHTTFAAVRGRLELVHLDEPGRAVLGSSTGVDHIDMHNHLVAITYNGWVSLVQQTVPSAEPADGLRQGLGCFANSDMSNGAKKGIVV
jgi:sugar phosphate isomerase/epimerase